MMKIIKNIIAKTWEQKNAIHLLMALLLLFQAGNSFRVQAAFDDMGAGARAPGMANSFVGAADDANALHYNPAGLTQLGEAEITTLYGRFLSGLDDGSNLSTTYLGYGQPLRSGDWGVLGLGFNNFKAANLLNERTFYLSYGWRLKNVNAPGLWSLGATVKQLYHSFEPDRFAENALNDPGIGTGQPDPLFKSGFSKTAYSMDLGSLYRFGPSNRYSMGLAFININRPDVSIGGDGDKVPFAAKFGLGYRPRWGLLTAEFRRVNRLSSEPDSEYAIGAERRFTIKDAGAFEIRGGYAEGSRDFKSFTAGLSYIFSKAELDYAYNFPLGNLADAQGNHRIGFSFKFGYAKGKEQDAEPERLDLIAAFANDPEASFVALKRAEASLGLSEYQQFLLLQTLLNKYAVEDVSTQEIREDLSRIMFVKKYQLMNWPSVKTALLVNIRGNEIADVEDALQRFSEKDPAFALARLALVSPQTRSDKNVKSLEILAHTELAAKAYRAKDIDACLDHVKQILELIPNDEIILVAYRQLLLLRVQSTAADGHENAPPVPAPSPLPEAPSALTAPKPVDTPTEAIHLSDFDKTIHGYGTALGYYFTRKADGAPIQELLKLLHQMKVQYANKGIDLSLVDKELAELTKKLAAPEKKTPQVEPKKPVPAAKPFFQKPAPAKATPAKKAAPKTAPRKAVISKPAPVKVAPAKVEKVQPASKSENKVPTELERQWEYYHQAVRRGVSDKERIELLEAIVIKFGEKEAQKAAQELEKLRKRMGP